MPTLLFKEVCIGEKTWKIAAFIVTTFHGMRVLRWFLQCPIDPGLLLLTAVRFCALGCFLFLFKQSRHGKTRLRHKKWVHECWESVYNILPSAALLYVDTCFKMWCISLYLSVLNTLVLSIVVAFCAISSLVDYDELATNERPILISHTYWLFTLPSCVVGRPPRPAPSCPPTFFLYFDTIFDYIYCPKLFS